MTGSAVSPESITSSWLKGCGEIPAARLVIGESPKTSILASLAETALRAVDIPTMWPPTTQGEGDVETLDSGVASNLLPGLNGASVPHSALGV